MGAWYPTLFAGGVLAVPCGIACIPPSPPAGVVVKTVAVIPPLESRFTSVDTVAASATATRAAIDSGLALSFSVYEKYIHVKTRLSKVLRIETILLTLIDSANSWRPP